MTEPQERPARPVRLPVRRTKQRRARQDTPEPLSESEGPYDARRYGRDAAGHPVNSFGRCAGMNTTPPQPCGGPTTQKEEP